MLCPYSDFDTIPACFCLDMQSDRHMMAANANASIASRGQKCRKCLQAGAHGKTYDDHISLAGSCRSSIHKGALVVNPRSTVQFSSVQFSLQRWVMWDPTPHWAKFICHPIGGRCNISTPLLGTCGGTVTWKKLLVVSSNMQFLTWNQQIITIFIPHVQLHLTQFSFRGRPLTRGCRPLLLPPFRTDADHACAHRNGNGGLVVHVAFVEHSVSAAEVPDAARCTRGECGFH